MLSVLIVNWNTRDMLRSCLRSLLEHPYKGGQEIIVVDNASGDGSADMVRAEFPSVELVASKKNTGYAAGNNLAFKQASGDWLLTLNPDTEVLPGTLDNAVKTLTQHPQHGVLGVKQVGPDGKVQDSVRGFPGVWGIFGELTGLSRLGGKLGSYRNRQFDYSKEQTVDQPMGTFLLFRRKALEAIGDAKQPFDEDRFPIFFNEVDLLFRLRQSGWLCLYSPAVEIKHHGGASTKQVRKNMIWESHKSLMRYLRKHYSTPLNAPFLHLLALIVYIGAFVRARGYHAGFRA